MMVTVVVSVMIVKKQMAMIIDIDRIKFHIPSTK